jgi:cell wall assembly regulator SMI1
MQIRIEDSESSVTPERIAEIEKKISYKLPEDYKRFLLAHNGGHPEPCVFDCRREGEELSGIVAWFLAICDGPHENFMEHYKLFQEGEIKIPDGTVPIARDPGGSLILLGLKEPSRGKVFFWTYHGPAEEPEALYFIADSFDEFLASLHEGDE